MANKTLTTIKIETTPNGYSLDVADRGYFYFNLQELLHGFIYHVGLEELQCMNDKGIQRVIEAAISWKDNGKLVKELTHCKEKLERLETSNKNLKKRLSKYTDDLDDLD